MDELIKDFLIEIKEGLEILDTDLLKLEKNPNDKKIINNLFRVMHTIKGTCGFLGLTRLGHIAHAGEDVMDKVREGKLSFNADIVSIIFEAIDHIKLLIAYIEEHGAEQAGDDENLISRINSFAATNTVTKFAGLEITNTENVKPKKAATQETIRININILEELMQSASELVLIRNQLLQLQKSNKENIFTAALQSLNNITTELHENIMKTRMQPISTALVKLPRIVRDLSIELGKKIDLTIYGKDTELDRQLLEVISDPLMHMIRNSVDHGIETPATRTALGKPENGIINISASHIGGYVIIEITDDGQGIDRQIIKRKAIEKGLLTEAKAANMADKQLLQFIFAAGFSTAEKISPISGRGVGMDVVKNNIEKISGTIELASEVGKGTKFTIKIPLTLAIIPVLKLEVQGHKFAIPQLNVREVLKTGKKSKFNIEALDKSLVLRLRGKLLPLISLSEMLGIDKNIPKDNGNFVIICEIGDYSFGLIVDKVLDTEEIVVKPVSPIFKYISIYSGSAILGDGSVILILEPTSLAKLSGEILSNPKEILKEELQEEENNHKQSFIIFQSGDTNAKIVPLELISRIEELDTSKIEYLSGVPVIKYKGELMRLINIDPNYKFPLQGMQDLLVVNDGTSYMGLAVEKIIDIVKVPAQKKIAGSSNGLLGSLVVAGKNCDIIDLSYYCQKAFSNSNSEKSKNDSSSSKMVLLVDDSPFFRKFIPPEIEKAGFSVTISANGKDALAKLKSNNKYAAIITDIAMPAMTGDELAKLCRQNALLKDIPIIALSPEQQGTQHFNKDNFDAFVSKTNHKELIEILTNITSKKENVK